MTVQAHLIGAGKENALKLDNESLGRGPTNREKLLFSFKT